MREVVIVDGVRTPIGKAGRDKGYYKDVRADDLAAHCVKRLLEKNPKLDPREIEDVVWGCANQTGEQGLNVGRMIALLAGLSSRSRRHDHRSSMRLEPAGDQFLPPRRS